MYNYTKGMNRKDFLKASFVAAATPALLTLTSCSSADMDRLKRTNPGVTQAQFNMIEYYSSAFLLHPPASRELLEFIVHLFTPEEAECVQHLHLPAGTTAREVAKILKRPEDEVDAVLSGLSDKKRAILAREMPGKPRQYFLMPLVPGTFELVMVEGKDDAWHRKFAQLFENIYNTEYIKKALHAPLHAARYIPIEKTIDNSPVVLPSDRLIAPVCIGSVARSV